MQMVGGIAAYRGVHVGSPVHTSVTATGSSPTPTAPSMGTTVADALLVHAVTKQEDEPTRPPGTTSRWGLISAPPRGGA